MRIADLIGFKRELFFEGAVQLGWLERNPARAELAARHYVFHGPEFHGVDAKDVEAKESVLKDTATFIRDVVRQVLGRQTGPNRNPFGLAIAGYGTGKSHLGLTLSLLLESYPEGVSAAVIGQLAAAAPDLAREVSELLDATRQPILVAALDGMANFELSSELYRKILLQLKARGLDLGPIYDLSPRFGIASQFVQRNYELRRPDFEQTCGRELVQATLLQRLSERDEAVFSLVDQVFQAANGYSIPVEGQESPQTLIDTVCEHYCGPSKPFAALLILFDEFGRYLEFAADKPHLAGDSGLQQIFQGVQDNAAHCYFLGLIQYDLKAYLTRINRRETVTLQRYVSRYDSAEKTHLSSNLETLFAHLIQRKDEEALRLLLATSQQEAHWREVHRRMATSLPDFGRLAVWRDFDRFFKIIVQGCWPLHPFTVWFLAQHQNIVQNRSAISFVEAEITKVSDFPAQSAAGPFAIHAADLCLGEMLQEILAAEKNQHGTIAEAFASIRERHAGRLSQDQLLILAAVVVAQKIKIQATSQAETNAILGLLSGLPVAGLQAQIRDLTQQFGVIEWNEDLRQYDLIVDAVPRSQFSTFLRQRLGKIGQDIILGLFETYGKSWGSLQDLDTSFAEHRNISTTGEWIFTATCATRNSLKKALNKSLDAWKDAHMPDEPRGQLLYYLMPHDADVAAERDQVQHDLDAACLARQAERAPLFVVLLHDETEEISENLARLSILDHQLSDEELSRFQHFLEPERESAQSKLEGALQRAIKNRNYVLPSGVSVAATRLKSTASELLEVIYSQALPFPFDGFATTRGNAAKDCATITRAVALRQLSTHWFSTLSPQVRNRATTLLDRTWQAVTEDMRLAPEVRQAALHLVLANLGQAIKDRQRINVWDALKELMAPPYGLNLASGGLVMALFIGHEFPQKSLEYDGDVLPVDEWLEKAYGKRNFLDSQVLAKTTLVYVSEDAAASWRKLLGSWEMATEFETILNYRSQARQLAQRVPVPEEQHDRFRLLSAASQQAESEISEYERKLGEMEDQLAHFELNDRLELVLKCAKSAHKLFISVQENNGRWNDTQRDAVKQIVARCKQYISCNYLAWLKEQACNDPMQYGDFRSRLEQNYRTFEGLGLLQFRKATQDHCDAINRQAKERLKYASAIEQAKTFLASHQTFETVAVATLDDWINQAKTLSETLNQIQQTLPAADLAQLSKALIARSEALRSKRREHRDRLGELAERTLANPQDVREALDEADNLASLFKDIADDFEFVGEMRNQLRHFHERMRLWIAIPAAPEDVEGQLRPLVEEQLRDDLAAEDTEPVWDAQQVYNDFLAHLQTQLQDAETLRKEQAHFWLARRLPPPGAIQSYEVENCKVALQQLENPPGFLSRQDLETVAQAQRELHARLDALDYASLKERVLRLPAAKRQQLVQELLSDIEALLR